MIELLLFRTGAVEIVRSAFAPWIQDREEGARRSVQPVWSALIRTPDATILFDTGLHPVHVSRPDATFGPQSGLKIVMDAEDAIVARLASVGVRPEDVGVVVNSHLHFDHAGNNGAFPQATFVVQRDHLAFAKGRPNFPGIYWDLPELRYVPADGRMRVTAGVEVVPTPGHAPGHQSLVVDLGETGRVVLCGDAAYTRENLERDEIAQPEAEAGRASLATIRSLVGGDLGRAFPSHDMTAWTSWRHAPAAYR